MKLLSLSLTLFFSATGLSASASVPSVAPERAGGYTIGKRDYESSAIIEIIFPPRKEGVPNQKQAVPGPEFMERQREEILADENLREAIEELMPGAVLDHAAFFDQARKGLKVENIKGTDLLKIAVRSGDKRFGCDLANRLTDRYLKNHKPKEGDKGPIVHQKAVLGVPIEKKKQEVEQGAP